MTKKQIKKKIADVLDRAIFDYKSEIYDLDENGELVSLACFQDLTGYIEDYFDVDLYDYTCWLQNKCMPSHEDFGTTELENSRWYKLRFYMVKRELFHLMEVLSND